MTPAPQPPTGWLRDLLFTFRCTAASALSYALAAALDLQFPSWAAVSALVVSQEQLSQTRAALVQRIGGTLIGILIAMLVGALLSRLHAGTLLQMSAGIAIAALVGRKWPSLKVGMWTVPIVYLSNLAHPDPLHNGVLRGIEVLIGGIIGILVHLLVDAFHQKLVGMRSHPRPGPVDQSE